MTTPTLPLAPTSRMFWAFKLGATNKNPSQAGSVPPTASSVKDQNFGVFRHEFLLPTINIDLKMLFVKARPPQNSTNLATSALQFRNQRHGFHMAELSSCDHLGPAILESMWIVVVIATMSLAVRLGLLPPVRDGRSSKGFTG